MFIQRVNIFLLSLCVAFSPVAAFATVPAMGVSSLLPMQGAVEALISDLSAQGSAVAAASMEVGTSALVLGGSAVALATAGRLGYVVGTQLNNAFCISDAISAALFNANMTCGSGIISKDNSANVLNPTFASTVWASPRDPARYFTTPDSSCSDEATIQGRTFSHSAQYMSGGFHCFADNGYQYSNTNSFDNPNYDPSSSAPTTTATPLEIGNAIAASPQAVNEVVASTAMAAAAAAAPDISDCSKIGGTFNLNSGLCLPARDKLTGKPLTGLESAEHAAAMAALFNSTANSKTKTDAAIAMSQAYDAALADALANPTDQSKQDKLAAAIKDLGIANANATTANTAATADATKAAATPDDSKYPAFCTWAIVVCDVISFMKETPVAATDTKVSVETSTPSPVQSVDLNYQYVNFGTQCPAPIPINFTLMGRAVNTSITYIHVCEFLSGLKPFVIAASFIGAIYIVSGSNRPVGDS